MKRRGYDNLTHRLARRECMGAPPGAVTPQSRRLAENVVPDTAVPGLVPPPNTVLHSFTPCGRYLLAFQPVTSEVVAYRFKGLHVSISASSDDGAGGGSGAAAGGQAQGQAHAAQQPLWQQQAQPQASQTSSQTSQSVRTHGSTHQPASGLLDGQQAQQQQQHGFGDVFEEHWRCCPCPSRREQISPDFCAVAHGRFLLVCTTSPERPPPASATGAAELVPYVDRTSFHVLELESGCLLGSHTLRADFVELTRSQGAHLRGHLLLVLGLASQTLHVLHLLPTGRLQYLHAIGQHCMEDDALVIAQLEAAERRLRQQQEEDQRQARQQLEAPGASGWPAGASSNAAAGGRPGGAAQAAGLSPAQPAGLRSAVTPAQGFGHNPQLAAAGAPAAAAATAAAAAPPAAEAGAAGPVDMDTDEEDSGEHSGQGGRRAAGDAGPLLSGLKQRLLAYLYREAQQQSEAAAAAALAAPCTGACGQLGCGQPAGLHGAFGSTASLLSAVARAHHRLAGITMTGSGLWAAGGSTTSLETCGSQQGAAAAHWRRPLDRFCYYFQAHCELVMWKAQLLDEQRLLVHWCPPEVLGVPHHRNGHSASSAAAHGAAGSYVMVYHMEEACVEKLFVAHSAEFAAWYLAHPAAFCGAGCPCGCGSDWERFVAPPGASRATREQQQRDPQQAAKDLRHRLADELPASSQTRQATPYLDPDLYFYDERAVGGAIRPHHPPHRSLKFMCRCQPERLRFRLDPEHLAVPTRGGGGGGSGSRAAAARARHVVYLFHPMQPFLLVVSQDIESAVAEHLTLFTRI